MEAKRRDILLLQVKRNNSTPNLYYVYFLVSAIYCFLSTSLTTEI